MGNVIEKWLPVVGYESTHMVSNMGRVKTIARNWVSGRYNNSVRHSPEKILTPIKHTLGYLRVNIHFNGVRKFMPIHRLVAMAFIPNPLNKPEVNHKYGIKSDNRASQLEWVTKSENNKHAYNIGLNSPLFGGRKKRLRKDNPLLLKTI